MKVLQKDLLSMMSKEAVVSTQKWKTKRRQHASAARMCEIKKAKLEAVASTPGGTAISPDSSSASSAGPFTLDPAHTEEQDEAVPDEFSESENEKPTSAESGSSDEEFDAQKVFDDWMVSLSLYDRKMLAVFADGDIAEAFQY